MAIHSFASRAMLRKVSRSLRPNDIRRHRLMLTDRSTSSDEPGVSCCRLPQRLLFLHVQGQIGFGSRSTLRVEPGSANIARLMPAQAKAGWRVERCTPVASSANVAELMIEMSRRCKTA